MHLLAVAPTTLEAEGLAALLGAGGPLEPEAVEASFVLAAVARRTPKAVVWLADRADATLLEIVDQVRARPGSPKVLLVARTVDAGALRAMLTDGDADGLALLTHSTRPQARDLRRSLMLLMSGIATLSPRLIDHLLAEPDLSADPLAALTPDELEVLDLLALGLRNHAIAVRLSYSVKVIEKRVGRIFTKLGLDLADHPDIDRRVRAVRIYLSARADVAMPVKWQPALDEPPAALVPGG